MERAASSPSVASPEGAVGLRLDDHLCFTLHAASRAITALYRPLLEDLGLTYPQYLVMLALWEREPMSVKELGAVLQLDYGTLSPLLKRMESAGLLARVRRAEDERSVDVRPTAAGRALRRRAAEVPPLIARAMALEPRDYAALQAALRSLTEAVRATAADEGGVGPAS